jgi:peptidoglycan LD-endopeptidase LytH
LDDRAHRPKKRRNWRTAGAVLGGFVLGAGTVLLVLWLYASDTPAPGPPAEVTPAPAPTRSPTPAPAPAPRQPSPNVIPPAATDLDERTLVIPVSGIRPDQLQNTFDDARGGGERVHQAMDILAPRNTPVVAVEGGRIAKLFTSAQGGLTIYQFDPTESYAYYYAHLESYAPGLREGITVRQGDLLGYVGTSGNAGPDNPHLHFAVYVLGPEKRWWEGTPVNPYPLLRRAQAGG